MKWFLPGIAFFMVLASPGQSAISPQPAQEQDKSQIPGPVPEIQFVTDQKTFDRNLTFRELSTFSKALESQVKAGAKQTSFPYRVKVWVTLTKNTAPMYSIKTQGGATNEMQQGVYDALKSMPDLRTAKEDVVFTVLFKIKKFAEAGASQAPQAVSDNLPGPPKSPEQMQSIKVIQAKMDSIVLPDIDFHAMPLMTALDKVRTLARESDPESGPGSGVNLVLKVSPGPLQNQPITLEMKAPTLGQAMNKIGKQSGMKVFPEPYAIALVPLSDFSADK